MFNLLKKAVLALSLVLSSAVFAGPIEVLANGKFQVNICELNGNQMGRDLTYNFYAADGSHLTGGRVGQDQCISTKLSNVSPGQNVTLEVATRSGGVNKASFTIPGSQAQPQQQRGSDLLGYCQDGNHVEFEGAKAFAYSASGLDLSSAGATDWALMYINTHRCGTIGQYQSRFAALYDLAYSASYMDMSKAGAIAYALSVVDSNTVDQINQAKDTFSIIYDFVYSASYLDKSKSEGIAVATKWIENACEPGSYIRASVMPAWRADYDFAYSAAGLDLSKSGAISYATQRIANLSVCAALLPR